MRKLILSTLMAATLTLLSSCSSKQLRDDDPKAMFDDASDHAESGRYELALEQLRIVKNKFPYSKYSAMAQLKIADVYFMQESFPEAAASYELFRELHPNHQQVAYAMYRVGESHFQDIPSTIARDLAPADRALEAFETFIRKYPNAKESPDAHKRIKEIRSTLADKEKYIGDFYRKRDRYRATEGRYSHLLDQYPETAAATEVKPRIEKVRAEATKEREEARKKLQADEE